ncbi:MAG: M20/M25/M40 family metallo-hydrolase, partial [Patescibacteria group bacterium]
SIGLIEINGGLRDNVIPAEAMAIITVPKELENDLRTAIEQSNATISMKPLDVSATYILTKQSEIDLIALLKNLPHGVLKRHPELDSVETSANLAKITVSEKGVEILLSVRSCSQVGEDAVVLDIVNTFRTDFDPEEFGIEHLSPPWRPNLDSNLLAKAKKIYGIFYGKPPKINVMHAGLEAAILVQNYPSMEAISIGPNIFDVHTPQENIEIDSAERCWEFLTALLASL